jgi:hypothetical protein
MPDFYLYIYFLSFRIFLIRLDQERSKIFFKRLLSKNVKRKPPISRWFFSSGRNSGARTRDLLVPNQAHYQLCHVPTWREFSHVVIYHFENGIKRESSGLFRPFRQERQVSSGFRYRFGSVSSGLEGLLLR